MSVTSAVLIGCRVEVPPGPGLEAGGGPIGSQAYHQGEVVALSESGPAGDGSEGSPLSPHTSQDQSQVYHQTRGNISLITMPQASSRATGSSQARLRGLGAL